MGSEEWLSTAAREAPKQNQTVEIFFLLFLSFLDTKIIFCFSFFLSLSLSLVGFYFHFWMWCCCRCLHIFLSTFSSARLVDAFLEWIGRVYTLKGKTAEEKFHFQTPTQARRKHCSTNTRTAWERFPIKVPCFSEIFGEGVEQSAFRWRNMNESKQNARNAFDQTSSTREKFLRVASPCEVS